MKKKEVMGQMRKMRKDDRRKNEKKGEQGGQVEKRKERCCLRGLDIDRPAHGDNTTLSLHSL